MCRISDWWVARDYKWNMLLNESSIFYFHCGGVLRIGCFGLPSIEAMFSSIDWFVAVLVVVAELESNTRALRLKRNFRGRNVLEMRRNYHLFDYCCIFVQEDRVVPCSRVLEVRGLWKE